MKVPLNEFSFGVDFPGRSPKAANYRPQSWPPSRNWPVSIDKNGGVVSRWGDSVWDLTPLAGTRFCLNFGDGEKCQTDHLDNENADLLRLAMTWLMWGSRAARSTGTIQQRFTMVRAIIAVCNQSGINAASLMRFPKVFELLPAAIAPSRYETTVATFHRLYDAREVLGFTILDAEGLKRLAAAAPAHEEVQTPYIPPRIWVYQVARLRHCLADFITHRKQFEACYMFCLQAYATNYGSLSAALVKGKDGDSGPFNKNCRTRAQCTYQGSFIETASRFEIAPLLSRWVGSDRGDFTVSVMSAYMSLVTAAGLAYIANFTLQRKEEVASLRASCLIWEEDETLGRIPIICGETTKTDRDSDARWIASPSIEIAVEVLSVIAHLRMLCDRVNPLVGPSATDQEDPYLFSAPNEPWATGRGARPYGVRTEIENLKSIMRIYPSLLDQEQLRITNEDLNIARRLTPNLPKDSFDIRKIWPLAWHQYRRTSAVNMFASGLISDSSMQQQMKHSSRLMPLYYGRGHTRLHLNEKVEATVMNAMYAAMAERLKGAVSDRFVAAHSEERKEAVNLLSMKDTKTLVAWAKIGRVSFREHRLGGCLKAETCEYGGIESVARCAGGDGAKPCSDVLFDRAKEQQVRADLHRAITELNLLPADSPRYNALISERRAMENYLNVISVN